MTKKKPLTKKEKEAQTLIINTVEQALNGIYDHLVAQSTATGGMVSTAYIKLTHTVWISNMKKGAGIDTKDE